LSYGYITVTVTNNSSRL